MRSRLLTLGALGAVTFFALCGASLPAQAPQSAPTPAPIQRVAPPQTNEEATIGKPSELVTPALDGVAKAGSNIDLNRWRGGNAVREDIDGKVAAIQKDLQSTLPPLLIAADRVPMSVSASLPVLLNMDALYDVLLRISIAGKAAAPRDQSDAIDGALASLDGARRDMGERITRLATSQEEQLAVAQQTIQQQASAAAAQQVPATSATTTKTRKRKAATKPAATTSTKSAQ